jgi:hypothetical protein
MNKIHPRSAVLKISAILAIIPCLILLLTFPVSAQKTSGQISGTVLDQSGAAIPDATINITQVGTNAQRVVTTNAEGGYTVPDLPIGIYKVSVTKTGFKETIAENVTVNVASITRQDFNLEVGQVGATITIQSDDIQVETQTGQVGEVVTGVQVRELPLNGRNFAQLTQLQPGVSAANGFDTRNKGLFSGVDFSVNGNSAQSNLFLTDGANNNDTGSNRTVLLYPSIEAIAEFKMLRNSYGPEYGQAAGSVISLVTRGGSNEFHGSLFYFGRNDALNATEFFANRGGTGKDKLRRHDYGFALGGPIVKDRLFFFWSEEWNKEIRGSTRFANVPTQAERNGDFRDPARRACNGGLIRFGRPGDLLGRGADGNDDPNIPGNPFTTVDQVVPQSQVSQAGLLLAQLYPLPNRPGNGCNNWSESVNSPINFREDNVRIDYNFSKSHQIFGRYTQDHWANPFPILFGAGLWGDDPFPVVESGWTQPSRQAAIKLTSTLSGNAVNEVQFSYSANRIRVDPGSGSDLNRQINQAVPGFFPDDVKLNGLDRPHPVFWGGIQPFASNRGADLWTQAPFRNSLDIYSIRDDFSKVMGNHTFKMGFLFDKAAKNEDSGPNNETPQFWGACCANNSGNYLADVLTKGSLFGYNESNRQAVANTRYTNLEFYFGDTWKVRSNITLELGARYSILFEPYDKLNAISSFDPALYNPARPASDPCNGLVVPKGSGNPCSDIPGATAPAEFSNRSLRENNYKNIAPRLGFAWDVFSNGRTAIRGGFGQFFLRERVGPVVGALTLNPPFVRGIGAQRTLDGTVYSSLPAASAGAPQFSFDPRPATPYSLQFHVSLGQELWKGTALEVGYVGNRARNQLTHYDINQVPVNRRVQAAFAADANAVNALRPFSNFGSIYQWARRGSANYDSVQVLFRTRFWNNSQFQAAYTFSRSLANFGLNDSSNGRTQFAWLDTNNPELDFAESDINRPHIFVANAIFNLPSLKDTNPFIRTIFGDWELATIVQFASGTSLTPQIGAQGITALGSGTALQAGITGTGTAVANQRPLRVEGTPCTLTGSDGTQFINPAAFTLVGLRIGEVNNQKRGTCLGSPTKNVDFSIYKNFAPGWLKESFFGEGARVQVRFEMFNAFNTAQFNGASIGLTYFTGQVVCGNAPCSATNNTITGLAPGANPDANFGRAGATRGGREIQYAVKFIF